MQAYFTVDVEKDLHTGENQGIIKGIPAILKILKKHKIKANFFVTGEVIGLFPGIIKRIKLEGHEIGIHGYSHKRFDSMNSKQKNEELEKSVKVYSRVLGKKPSGFRAPQHSIDEETIILLKKYGFNYDSSICSGNVMLLRHLAKKDSDKKQIIKSFFGRKNRYRPIDGFDEIPRCSPVLALGGFELKAYPTPIINSILNFHRILRIPLNFVMHSWDMIDIKESKTSKYCSAKEFEKRLDSFLFDAKQKFRFIQMEKAS